MSASPQFSAKHQKSKTCQKLIQLIVQVVDEAPLLALRLGHEKSVSISLRAARALPQWSVDFEKKSNLCFFLVLKNKKKIKRQTRVFLF